MNRDRRKINSDATGKGFWLTKERREKISTLSREVNRKIVATVVAPLRQTDKQANKKKVCSNS